MKTLKTSLFAGVAALAFGGAAFAQSTAQTAAPTAPHQGHQHQAPTPEQRAQFQAKRAEMIAKRTQQLHDELGITSGQESAWKSFVASMQPAARPAQADHAAWAGLSAPERMAKMIDLQKQHTVQMEQRLGALNSFYSVLSPEQKKVFDTKAAQLQAHWGGHGGRGHHGGQAQG